MEVLRGGGQRRAWASILHIFVNNIFNLILSFNNIFAHDTMQTYLEIY